MNQGSNWVRAVGPLDNPEDVVGVGRPLVNGAVFVREAQEMRPQEMLRGKSLYVLTLYRLVCLLLQYLNVLVFVILISVNCDVYIFLLRVFFV